MTRADRTILVLINIFGLVVNTFAQQTTVTKTVTIPLTTITVTESVPTITGTRSTAIPVETSSSYSTFFSNEISATELPSNSLDVSSYVNITFLTGQTLYSTSTFLERSCTTSGEKSVVMTPNATYSITISTSGTTMLPSASTTAHEIIDPGKALISTSCANGECSYLSTITTDFSDPPLITNTTLCTGTKCISSPTTSSLNYTLKNVASNSTMHSVMPTHFASNGSTFNSSSSIPTSVHGMNSMSTAENKAISFNSRNILGIFAAVVLAFSQ